MNADAVREWLNRQPFEPFELRLSNGEVYQVRHPENIAIGKNRIAVVDPGADRFVHIALVHINSIEALQTA
jgi:leucyl aminopeptidase (aminopeptidase T)